MDLLHSLLFYLKPEGINQLIQQFGLIGICAIVFAETGFFPLLPGDSLLVLCGIAAGQLVNGEPVLSLGPLMILVPLCAIAGDQIGYVFGSLVGKSIYGWRERKVGPVPIFKQAWLHQTQDFYERWGVFTIVVCRWVPIVRTFAPVVAGVTRMPYKKFIPYNVIGAVSWVWSMLLTGYFLDAVLKKVWPGFELAKNIDKIALIIVLISVMPILYTVFKERVSKKKKAGSKPARSAPKRKKR